MKRISVLGYSNSGKTTLIEKLIERCTDAEYQVAYLKYSSHPGEFDRPGSDTDRGRVAGATFTAYRNTERWYITVDGVAPIDPPTAELPAWLIHAADSVDVVIAEGRLLPDSFVVLTGKAEADRDRFKYSPDSADLVVYFREDPHTVGTTVEEIFNRYISVN